MKQLIYKICLCSIFVLWAACSDDESIWREEGNSTIKLRFTDGIFSTYSSRAEVNDTDMERAISHLDVFFFDASGSLPAIHERVFNLSTEGEDETGTVSLNVSLNDFKDRPNNFVYVIANAKNDLSSINDLDDLNAAIQVDERIHVTGIPEISDAPQYFLMDGQATGSQNQSTPAGAVYIDSGSKDDVTLNVSLKRAAAKVVVTLNEFVPSNDYTGDVYRFLQSDDNYEKGYYFRNMPYKTKILGGQEGNAAYPDWTSEDYLRMPDKANDSAFEWLPEGKVVVTAYVYSHKWRNVENDNYYARGTSLVVNIPMWKDEDKDGVLDDGETVYKNSYYQIPIVNKNEGNTNDAEDDYWQIDRNTVYELTATIKDPGAEDSKHPLELNIDYNTYEWNPKPINVAGDNVNYLEVNKEVLEMYNVADDATLTFTSSSPVTVTLSDKAYYYNKYGQKIEFNATDSVFAPDWNNGSLLGSIEISSQIPKNLTARYFNLTVTNQNDLSKTIKVIQYPVICVSNQLGYYSYREDFGFHWESINPNNNARVSVGANNENGVYKEDDNDRNYYRTSGSSSYFFSSKVIQSNPDENATSHASYFYSGNKRRGNQCESSANLRMYQMQIMATSDEYVVGKPRLNAKGYTDSSEENNRLVSPSFMIASRLGAVYSGAGGTNNLNEGGNGGLQYNNGTFSKVKMESDGFTSDNYWDPNRKEIFRPEVAGATYDVTNDELLKFYADHCKNYVEVVGTETNQKVYSDWRLPTAAEIVFIINHQGAKGKDADAIDYLLNGAFYYSAMGPIYNPLRDITEDGKAIRCVHDVYESDLVISKKE